MNSLRIISVSKMIDEIADFVYNDKALESLRLQGGIMQELEEIFLR